MSNFFRMRTVVTTLDVGNNPIRPNDRVVFANRIPLTEVPVILDDQVQLVAMSTPSFLVPESSQDAPLPAQEIDRRPEPFRKGRQRLPRRLRS